MPLPGWRSSEQTLAPLSGSRTARYTDGIAPIQSHPSPGKASFPALSRPVNRKHLSVSGDNIYFSGSTEMASCECLAQRLAQTGYLINEHYCTALLLATFAKAEEGSAWVSAEGISSMEEAESCYPRL